MLDIRDKADGLPQVSSGFVRIVSAMEGRGEGRQVAGQKIIAGNEVARDGSNPIPALGDIHLITSPNKS